MIRLFKSVFLSNDKFTQPGTQQIFVTPALSLSNNNKDFVMEDYDSYDEVIRMYGTFDEFVKMCDVWTMQKKRSLIIHADYYSYSKVLQSWLRMILPNINLETSYNYYNAQLTTQLMTKATGIIDDRMDASAMFDIKIPFDQWKRSWNRTNIKTNQNTVEWIEDNKHTFDGMFAISTFETTGQMFDAVSSIIVKCLKKRLSAVLSESKASAFPKIVSGDIGGQRYDMSNMHEVHQNQHPIVKLLYDNDKFKSITLTSIDDKNYFSDDVDWSKFTEYDIDLLVEVLDVVGLNSEFTDTEEVRWAFSVVKNNEISYNDYKRFIEREQQCDVSFAEHDFMLQYCIAKTEDTQMMKDYSLI